MADKYTNTKVTELTLKDFDLKNKKLKKKPKTVGLIVFYYSWCGFCVQLTPEFIKLSKKAGVTLFAVHGSNELKGNDKVFAGFRVEGVPNIRYVSKDGKISSEPYFGGRTVDIMHAFIKSKALSGGSRAHKGGCKKCKRNCSGGACKKKLTGGKRKVVKKKSVIRRKIVKKKKPVIRRKIVKKKKPTIIKKKPAKRKIIKKKKPIRK